MPTSHNGQPHPMPPCDQCGGYRELYINIDTSGIVENILRALRPHFGRIERALTNQGVTMSVLDDKLSAVTAAIAELSDDVTRELADLQKALEGTLTPEQSAALDTVLTSIASIKSAVDTVDAPPAPEEPTEGDTPSA
jgi:hypothetical protein